MDDPELKAAKDYLYDRKLEMLFARQPVEMYLSDIFEKARLTKLYYEGKRIAKPGHPLVGEHPPGDHSMHRPQQLPEESVNMKRPTQSRSEPLQDHSFPELPFKPYMSSRQLI